MKKPKKLRSRKAGLPPGSLVPIGEQKTPSATISIIDYGASGLFETVLPDTSALSTYQPQNGILWANLYGQHSAESLTALGRCFGLHPLVLEDVLNTDQRQKIDAYDKYLYVVIHRYGLGHGPVELVQDQISLVIAPEWLLTIQEQPSRTFEPVRQRLRGDRNNIRNSGTDMLAYSLIDSVVDSYFAIIEHLYEHAEDLESSMLANPAPSTLDAIHQLKRCVSQLRRNLQPLRELLGSMLRENSRFFTPDVQLYLRDVYDHTIHILESLEDLRDLASGLLDIYLSTVSHRVNLEVRALTIVATIFMPLTLVAGIFGMNFRQMPWLDRFDGFYYAMGLMAAIALIMLALFWHRRAT